jgi:hypothetical protein
MRPKMTTHEQDHLLYEQKPSVPAFFHPPTALFVGIAIYLFCIGAKNNKNALPYASSFP